VLVFSYEHIYTSVFNFWTPFRKTVPVGRLDVLQVDSMYSVLDENNQLLHWAKCGVRVEMYKCTDIDDFEITESNAETFRRNYLGIVD
jgi:hypothetical protein